MGYTTSDSTSFDIHLLTPTSPHYPTDLTSIRTLFTAYTTSLGLDLTFQNLAHELSSLPGKYAQEEGGALLLAIDTSAPGSDREAIGCIGLRYLAFSSSSPSSPKTAELKRLYTLPSARGRGIGAALVDEVLKIAKEMGYKEVRLDTLPEMGGARRLYEQKGFGEVGRYYETPLEGTLFLGRGL